MSGFVRAREGALVDDSGPLLLRGVGLGNWLVPEGYMWGLGPLFQSPRQIEGLVASVLGWHEAQEFWRRWRASYVTEVDLDVLVTAGLDHVRLPMNWRLLMSVDGTVLPDGFETIDLLLERCRSRGLRVVLDLHAAPGGQTGTNIDDSLGLPELFLDDHWKMLTVQLWRTIAERYANEEAVLAYDLLNEPLPHQWADAFGADLIPLYAEITAAIRAVDRHHLLMYEGTRWATDFADFTAPLDPNSALQFHKYWSRPDDASLTDHLAAASRLGMPLYMGETGENTLDWLASATALYERAGISWCFWPHKKVQNPAGVFSIPAPRDWEVLTEYQGEQVTPAWKARAAAALWELLESVPSNPRAANQELLDALMRRTVRLPVGAYVDHSPGVTISWPDAFDYDQGTGMSDPMDAVAHVPAGGWIDYQVPSSTVEPTVSVHSGEVGVATQATTSGWSRLRVRAVTDAALRGVVLDDPEPE
ncbi:MAG TPA: cellulase family glycosylhydrolase [Propionibacteriaceae bacterium]|nr:cellulase family glycosylhydrolase [Propionibacteriaceae bacterium]